jgi:hypothetical protein
MGYTKLLVFVATWVAFGVLAGPIAKKILPSFKDEKLDKTSFLLFAIYGPIPAIYFVFGVITYVISLAFALLIGFIFSLVTQGIKIGRR